MNSQATPPSPPATEAAGINFVGVESFGEQIDEFVKAVEARAYERYERRGREEGHALDDWCRAEAELRCMVPVGIFEALDQLEVNVRLLGCLCHEIEACVESRRLLLRVGKEEGQGQKLREGGNTERRLQGIFLTLNLPDEIDPAKVTAVFEEGNLCLTLPRAFA